MGPCLFLIAANKSIPAILYISILNPYPVAFSFFKTKERQLASVKKKLIKEMQKMDMKTLLFNMSSKALISPIIAEQQQNGHFSSEDTVSWFAMLLSFELSSPKDKNELLALLHNEAYAHQLPDIYRCLGSICGNTNDEELCSFLINVADSSQDEHIIISILSRLEKVDKGSDMNIAPIKKYLKEGSAAIIRAAVKALAHTNDPEVEDLLIEEFTYADNSLKSEICHTLKSVGTTKSIPMLQQASKKTRDANLRMHISETLMKIEA